MLLKPQDALATLQDGSATVAFEVTERPCNTPWAFAIPARVLQRFPAPCSPAIVTGRRSSYFLASAELPYRSQALQLMLLRPQGAPATLWDLTTDAFDATNTHFSLHGLWRELFDEYSSLHARGRELFFGNNSLHGLGRELFYQK